MRFLDRFPKKEKYADDYEVPVDWTNPLHPAIKKGISTDDKKRPAERCDASIVMLDEHACVCGNLVVN